MHRGSEEQQKIGILQNPVARKKQSSAVGLSPAGAKPRLTGEKERVGSRERKRQKRLPKPPAQKPQPYLDWFPFWGRIKHWNSKCSRHKLSNLGPIPRTQGVEREN